MQATAKRVTLATIKSFIRKNRASLLIKVRAQFDGMIDGLSWNAAAEFNPALDSDRPCSNNLGIQGVWCVLGSRDSFEAFETESHIGYKVYNCCGSFHLAVAK